MTNFHTLIESLEGDLGNLATIRAEIEKLGLSELRQLLKNNGLNNANKINDKTVAADLALSLFSPNTRSPRSNETKSVEGLIAGKVYDDDNYDVIHRLATKEQDKIQIWKVTESKDGQLNMVRDCEFDEHEAGACMAPSSEEEDESDVTPHPNKVHYEEDRSVTESMPLTQTSTHYKVDIKVVHWIPFRPNNIPIFNRFLPAAWKNAKTSWEAKMATKIMLSTGNAPPPNTFPNKASWDDFVNSKEYRAIFWFQVYICCPGETKFHQLKTRAPGFTPSPSNIKESPANTLAERLKGYHDRHQTFGSMLECSMASNGTVSQVAAGMLQFPYIQQLYMPDSIDDTLAKLIEKYQGKKPTPESHSMGRDHLDHSRKKFIKTKDCVEGTWPYFFRVGTSHNLLNYMLTGSLIPYQGGDMKFSLCCSTQKLSLQYNHTTVPSFKVYVNNDTAGQYDMMKSNFSSMIDSISGGKNEGDLGDDLLYKFSRPKLPPANIWETSVDIPVESGCEQEPVILGDWWPRPRPRLY